MIFGFLDGYLPTFVAGIVIHGIVDHAKFRFGQIHTNFIEQRDPEFGGFMESSNFNFGTSFDRTNTRIKALCRGWGLGQ